MHHLKIACDRMLSSIGFFLLFCLILPGYSQFFSTCDCASEAELVQSIGAHEEHNFRMSQKFIKIFYDQGKLPSSFDPTSKKETLHYLTLLGKRNPALLFYAYNENKGRFCAWLMQGEEVFASEATSIDPYAFNALVPDLQKALRISVANQSNIPRLRDAAPLESFEDPQPSLPKMITKVSAVMFPPKISEAIRQKKINTLVIVPSSNLGTIPFYLLQIGELNLVDHISIVVAPGFYAFKELPRKSDYTFRTPIIFGDPKGYDDARWIFPALPGARAEAREVAELLAAVADTGEAASLANFQKQLQKKPQTGLIYLATHGIADAIDANDSSFVLFSDGHLSARDISRLQLRSHPLVVLSACQTGLGKNFGAGTIGLARAFIHAGASQVIMSLWSIDDLSTRHLMTDFITLTKKFPVDLALQQAVQHARNANPGQPALWAGFSVFGVPSY